MIILLIIPCYPLGCRIARKALLTPIEGYLFTVVFGLAVGPFYLLVIKLCSYRLAALIGIPVLICVLSIAGLRGENGEHQSDTTRCRVPSLALVTVGLFMILLSVSLLNVGILNRRGDFLLPFKSLLDNPFRYFIWTFNFDFFKHLAFTNETRAGSRR